MNKPLDLLKANVVQLLTHDSISPKCITWVISGFPFFLEYAEIQSNCSLKDMIFDFISPLSVYLKVNHFNECRHHNYNIL